MINYIIKNHLNEFKMTKKVQITGGAEFIGSYLTDRGKINQCIKSKNIFLVKQLKS